MFCTLCGLTDQAKKTLGNLLFPLFFLIRLPFILFGAKLLFELVFQTGGKSFAFLAKLQYLNLHNKVTPRGKTSFILCPKAKNLQGTKRNH